MKIITSIKLLVLWLLIGFYSQAQTFSDWSNVLQVTTCPSVENLSVSVNPSNVTFSWKRIGDATTYTLSYKPAFAEIWTAIDVTSVTPNSGVYVANQVISGLGAYNWKISMTTASCTLVEVTGEDFIICKPTWSISGGMYLEDEGRIIKTASASWSNFYAITDQSLQPYQNGYISATISASDLTSNNIFFGLAVYNTIGTHSSINYAFRLSNAQLEIWEGGLLKGSFGALSEGDEIKIAREDFKINYYKKGVGDDSFTLLRDVSSSLSIALYLDVFIYNINQKTPRLNLGFCENPLTARVFMMTGDDCSTTSHEGSLKVNASGGSGNYSYLWSNSSTTPTISGLAAGGYYVVVTDNITGQAIEVEGSVEYTNPITWSNIIGMSQSGTVLTTTIAGWSASGAISTNSLAHSSSGSIKMIVKPSDLTNQYFWGFATMNTTPSNSSIRHGFHIKGSGRLGFCEASVFTNYGNISVGDELKITRSAGRIKYYINDVEVRDVASANGTFYVDLSGYTLGSEISLQIEGFTGDCTTPIVRESTPSEESVSYIDSELRAYPNPTNGELTLNYNVGEEGATVEVYNLMGQKVLESVWEADTHFKQVDLGQQAKGMYVVKVITSTETLTEKVIVR